MPFAPEPPCAKLSRTVESFKFNVPLTQIPPLAEPPFAPLPTPFALFAVYFGR
jgi:hypothetical protein